MTGSVGVSPGVSITGFPPSSVAAGYGVLEDPNSTNAITCAADFITIFN